MVTGLRGALSMAAANAHVTSADAGRRPLVLVAEDHEDTRAMLRMLLTMHGYDVADYGDGDTALDAAVRMGPDLAVVDGHLTGLDGFSLARAIRARRDV